jgi:hypothetical protein
MARSACDLLPLLTMLAPSLGRRKSPAAPSLPTTSPPHASPALLADTVAAIAAAGVADWRRAALLPLLEAIDRHPLAVMQGESGGCIARCSTATRSAGAAPTGQGPRHHRRDA